MAIDYKFRVKITVNDVISQAPEQVEALLDRLTDVVNLAEGLDRSTDVKITVERFTF